MNTQDITEAMTAWKQGKAITDKELQICVDAMKQTLLVISFSEEKGSIVTSFLEQQLRSMEDMQHLRIIHKANR